MFAFSSGLCSWINKDWRICSRRQLLSLPMTSGLWKSTRWSGLACKCLHTGELSDVLTCNRASCLTHDFTRHHHWRVSSWVMWPHMLRATTSLPKQSFAFFIFYSAFSWMTNKNLQHDHCSSICNALLMITVVIETFAICRLYRFLWPWFSL